MNNDRELLAMSQCSEILSALDPAAQARTVRYLGDRYVPGFADKELASRSGARAESRDSRKPRRSSGGKARVVRARVDSANAPDLARLVNDLKGLEDFQELSSVVLDRSDLLNRVILALAIYRRVYGDTGGITSGEIAQFYNQLGIKLGVPNISMMLSGKAKQFVMCDGVRRKGVIMRYKLSRHGVKLAAELGLDSDRAA